MRVSSAPTGSRPSIRVNPVGGTPPPPHNPSPTPPVNITPQGHITGSFQDVREQAGVAPPSDPYTEWLTQLAQVNAERAAQGKAPLPYPPAMLYQQQQPPPAVSGAPVPVNYAAPQFVTPPSPRAHAARNLGMDLLEATGWAIFTTMASWVLAGGARKLFAPRDNAPIIVNK